MGFASGPWKPSKRVWLKIKEPGPNAGFRLGFHFPVGAIFMVVVGTHFTCWPIAV